MRTIKSYFSPSAHRLGCGLFLLFFVNVVFLPTVASSAVSPPWLTWQRNPLTIPVTVNVTSMYAPSNAAVQFSLADCAVLQSGNGCNQPTNVSFLANLQVRREYVLTVIATNFNGCKISFAWTPNWTPITRGGHNGRPKTYQLVLDRGSNTNGVNDGSINATGGSCGPYTNTWTVELTEHLPINWRMEDGSDDPSFAPGDGVWAQIGPGKSLDPSYGAISWSVSLGRLMDGLAAGRLTLRESQITPAIFTPTNLYYTASSSLIRDQVGLIPATNNSPVLGQLFAYQCFVDIVALTNSTEMRFYHPNQIGSDTNELGQYTNITGDPFVVWALVNPAPPGTNQLYIIERRNGISRTNTIICNPASTSPTWTLQYGTGPETRVETRGVTISTAGGVTNRTEIDDIRYAGAPTPAYHAIETYQLYPWGFELNETDVSDGNPADDLVTTMEYYTDSSDPINYGQLESITYPDGYWEKHIFDIQWFSDIPVLSYVLRPEFDSPGTPDDATFNPDDYPWGYFYYQVPAGSPVVDFILFDGDGDYMVTDTYGVTPSLYPVDIQSQWGYNIPLGNGINENKTGYGGSYFCPNTYIYSMDDSYGFGYADHPIVRVPLQTANESSYYNGGTYDPVNKVFLVGTNDIWQGPDWRQSTIYWGVDDGNHDIGDQLQPFPLLSSMIVVISYAEGQPVYGDGTLRLDQVQFQINESWKKTQIYSLGSLVQTERYVITGVADNNTDQPICDLIDKTYYLNDLLGHVTNITWLDPVSGATRVTYSADYKGTNSCDGDLKLWDQDEQGIRTDYVYDSLKRVVAAVKEGVGANGGFPAQAAITNSITYDAQNRVTSTTTSSSGLSLSASASYDLGGRITSQTDTNGLTTTYVYGSGGRQTTVTLPSGATIISQNYLDRHLKSKTGTGIVNEFHNWQYEEFYDGTSPFEFDDPVTGTTRSDKIQYGYSGSARYRLQGFDGAGAGEGRLVATQTPDWNETQNVETFYNYGRPDRTSLVSDISQPTMNTDNETHFGYTFDGQTNYNATYNPCNDGLSLASLCRWTRSLHCYENDGGAWFNVVTNLVYRITNSAQAAITSVTKTRLNGFTSGNILSDVITYDADGSATEVTTTVNQTTKQVTEVTKTASSTLSASKITVNGLLQSQSSLSVASPSIYYYDSLGRITGITSPLGFTCAMSYNSSGQLASKTDFTGLTTTYTYYPNGATGAGQVSTMTVGGKTTRYAYTARGELYRSWGDVPYPGELVYDSFGDLTELHTFRGGTAWNGLTWPGNPGTPDVTTWQYQESTGLLTNKTDSAGRSVSYTYWQGLLKTRTWARINGTNFITLTNYYNYLGELIGCGYSDGTPAVNLVLNRTGAPQEIDDATGTNILTYDYAGRLISSSCQSGLMAGITVSNHFNPVYGRDAVAVLGLSSPLEDDYGYDNYDRLATVGSGTCSAAYGYLPNSDLLQTTTCYSNYTTVLTTTRTWDYGMRLRGIANAVGSAPVTSHTYQYDALNRRTQATLEDGSYWSYGYDDRDELTSAKRNWSYFTTAMPVSGQQFGYAYDNIGNRQTASFGGDINGQNLRTITYTNNSLNEYTGILTPSYANIIGVALATNNVTVNGGMADRHGEYFHQEITVANGGGPLWQNVTNISGTFTNQGGLLVPASSQVLTYDADGNLSSDSIWTYQWDAENRLISMTMTTNVANIVATNRLKLDFAYDFMGRRIQKIVSVWNSTTLNYQPSTTNRFIYDGWNLLAIINPQSSILQSFMWGQDLSGRLQGVGGVGGLLMATISGTNCFAAYDGNGNIMALINAMDKSLAARYEYSPYGELLRATGLLARQNPFRFSTKYWDDESALIYYGYRYYSPAVGKWIGRDPSGEKGGIHLYQFVQNSPIHMFDPNGRDPTSLQTLAYVGPLAAYADLCYTASSFAPGYGSTWFQAIAAGVCVDIDEALGGKLLESVGGVAGFLGYEGAGEAARGVQFGVFGNNTSQGLAAAVVSGRLEALAAIGAGASAILHGQGPSNGSPDFNAGVARAGFDMANDLNRGDTLNGSLDAAVLGGAVATDIASEPLQWGTMAMDLMSGDAAGAFSDLADYQGLNAWSMADDLQQ